LYSTLVVSRLQDPLDFRRCYLMHRGAGKSRPRRGSTLTFSVEFASMSIMIGSRRGSGASASKTFMLVQKKHLLRERVAA
jgi:hypothetical protein